MNKCTICKNESELKECRLCKEPVYKGCSGSALDYGSTICNLCLPDDKDTCPACNEKRGGKPGVECENCGLIACESCYLDKICGACHNDIESEMNDRRVNNAGCYYPQEETIIEKEYVRAEPQPISAEGWEIIFKNIEKVFGKTLQKIA